MRRGNEPAWKPLFRELQTGPVPDIWEAAKKLANYPSRNCAGALAALLERRDCPERSEVAAYALGWMHYLSPTAPLVACLSDARQPEAVRGQAAEGLGLQFMCNRRRTRQRSRAEAALLRGLSDPSATVRFWCCYALGVMRCKRAVPRLEHLRDHDTALAPRWWYVHEEAAEALTNITGEGTSKPLLPLHLRGEAEGPAHTP